MSDRLAQRRAARRLVWLALLVSLLAHLGAVLTIAWFCLLEPPLPPDAAPEEITVTLIEPPAPQQNMFVDTTAPESKPPEKTAFESDRDTAAASPEAARGGAAVPTQEGREQEFLELEDREMAVAEPAPVPPAPEIPATASAAPPSPPQESQLPERREEIKPKPEEDGIMVATDVARRPEEKAKPQPQPAAPAARPSYRPMTRATRLSGSIDSRGKAAVSALSTPLGRYRKAISDAVGSSWYYYIGSRMDMFSIGTVKVIFTIEQDGKARNPRVLSNTSNESFEIVTIESIRAAEIPPIPPDVLPVLDGGRIEIDFSFSIISY